MSSLMIANVALAGIDALLALVLAVVYWKNHRQIRSLFTLGLLLFALFLIAHNAMLFYHLATMMPQFVAVNEVYLLVEGALQTCALAVLLAATLR